MRILFAASEAVPFCKTGGLADVVGALSKVLHQHGHDVRLVLPRYQDIDQTKYRLLPMMPEVKVQYKGLPMVGSVVRCSYPGTQMPVYFIEEPSFSNRPGIYGAGRGDYPDNDQRFAFFNMAVLWLLKGLDWTPDIIHLHDWQTGLIPALLRHHPVVSQDPAYENIRTVFSIHNLAYQGNFDKFVVPGIGLPWTVFTSDGLEFYGKTSFLKSGLFFSDELIAVSPTYSREIQLDELGAGMAGTLRNRTNHLHGILNGIDTDEWNPADDKHIPHSFSINKLAGKAACKAAFQEEIGLPVEPKKPLVGMISRLVAAKGFDLITRSLDDLLSLDCQYIVLGSGEKSYEDEFTAAAEKHPDRFAAIIGYDQALSHRIIAASDIFMMPSYYEPCGLTQLYAMRYGTVPLVRRTGGLADSVSHATKKSIASGVGTGFVFNDYRPEKLVETLRSAVSLYKEQPDSWEKLARNAMRKDHSWNRSAEQYARIYESLVETANQAEN